MSKFFYDNRSCIDHSTGLQYNCSHYCWNILHIFRKCNLSSFLWTNLKYFFRFLWFVQLKLKGIKYSLPSAHHSCLFLRHFPRLTVNVLGHSASDLQFFSKLSPKVGPTKKRLDERWRNVANIIAATILVFIFKSRYEYL